MRLAAWIAIQILAIGLALRVSAKFGDEAGWITVLIANIVIVISNEICQAIKAGREGK